MPPVASPRQTALKVGVNNAIILENGHPTLITFAANPAIALAEHEVTPFGADGGEPINISGMLNLKFVTKAPRTLVEITDISMVVGYDPGVYDDIMAAINRKDTITVSIPDGTTHAAFGYLRAFKPQRNAEGNQPLADCTIVITNVDPTTHAEAGPVTVPAIGT